MITKNEQEKLKTLEKTKTILLDKKKTMLFDRSNSSRANSIDKKIGQKWYISPDASPKRFNSPLKSKRSFRGKINNFALNIKKMEIYSIVTPQKERISVAYSNENNKLMAEPVQAMNESELLYQIEEEISLKESKVGKKLSQLTIKRIIVIVLVLIFLTPLMDSTYWFDPTHCQEYGAKELMNLVINQTETNILNQYCKGFIESCGDMNRLYPLIYLSTPFPLINCNYSSMDPGILRNSEKLIFELDLTSFNYTSIVAVLDYRYNTINNAIIGILRTVFICLLLTIAALFITRDANELVIMPIERLIQKVNKLAENPLSIKDQKLVVDQDSENKELVLIENSIIKITTLLALGYGEAGSEILSFYMAKTGQMDYSLKGKKLYGIFGFCDIRNFTDATEVLQEDVMLFVNNIADIVHSVVDRYGGSANKNIGDAFLLVWKFDENSGYMIEEEALQLNPTDHKKINDTCDLALVAFSKIIAKINRSPKILEYRKDPRLCERIKDYKVKMVSLD